MLDTLVECRSEGDAKELIQSRAVEALDEAVGLRRAHLSAAVLDVIESQVEFIRMSVGTTELTPIVGQDGLEGQVMRLVEGQDIVVNHQRRRLRLLAGVEVAESIAAEGVDHGVEPERIVLDFAGRDRRP